MRFTTMLFLSILLVPLAGRAQEQAVQVTISLEERLGPMEIDHMALGQGGLSAELMWDNRIAEIRALRPSMIRLFIQEYFNLLPEPNRYHFDVLDRSVDAILKTGAEPLMCICFKPRVFFPEVNQDIVEPNDYDGWQKLIFNLVRHYRDKNAGIRYWEVANEPDIGESGGCPYRFKPDSYVRYYKHTIKAILQADPDARVGGGRRWPMSVHPFFQPSWNSVRIRKYHCIMFHGISIAVARCRFVVRLTTSMSC